MPASSPPESVRQSNYSMPMRLSPISTLEFCAIATPTPTCIDPFESLNAEQRLAVEHGLGDHSDDARPLLIIAGAGSGKTNTLAYRVANLILHQADPQRLLLLTFSRRAAMEMERRVGTVLNRVLDHGSGQ